MQVRTQNPGVVFIDFCLFWINQKLECPETHVDFVHIGGIQDVVNQGSCIRTALHDFAFSQLHNKLQPTGVRSFIAHLVSEGWLRGGALHAQLVSERLLGLL